MNWKRLEKQYPKSYAPIREHFEQLGKVEEKNQIIDRNILVDFLHQRGYLMFRSSTFINGLRLMETHLRIKEKNNV